MKKFQVSLILLIFLSLNICIMNSVENSSPLNDQFHHNQQSHQEPDGKITYTETVKVQQRARYKETQSKVHPQTLFKQFLFTISGVEQFYLQLPVSQQVAISMFTYVMVDNAYMRPIDIEDDPPIKVYIYENNNRVIHSASFHFQNYAVFEGLQHSTYSIRFSNTGSQKLITMNIKKLTELSHVKQAVNKQQSNVHAQKTRLMTDQLKYILNAFHRYSMINFQAVKALLTNLDYYYYWQILQTFVTILVCGVSISLIKSICINVPII